MNNGSAVSADTNDIWWKYDIVDKRNTLVCQAVYNRKLTADEQDKVLQYLAKQRSTTDLQIREKEMSQAEYDEYFKFFEMMRKEMQA